MPRLTPANSPKSRKATQDNTSGEQRLRMAFKRHLIQAKDALAHASILMDIHKEDFTAEDTARLNQALLIVNDLVVKHKDIKDINK